MPESTPQEGRIGTKATGHPGEQDLRERRWRLLVIAALMVVVSVLHVVTDPHAHQLHDFYFKITYIQIILAALWYGVRGGLLVSGITSLVYAWHIAFQLGVHAPHSTSVLLLEILLYNVIAFLVGLLADRQRTAHRRLGRAHRDLEASYAALREQAEALVEAETELRESHRLKVAGQLAAEFAHEVRNPLGGIVGAAEILARDHVDRPTREEFSDVLTREVRRLDQVVSGFLDFAKEGGQRQEGRLGGALGAVQTLLARSLAERRITLEVDDRTGDALLAMRPDHLTQVLLNLLLNAIEAVGAGGRIEIVTRRDGDTVRLRIADDGPGVPAELGDRIFEPFVSGREGGSGLGLAIVRRLLEEAGGSIERGARERAGAVFELTVPVASTPSREEGRGG